MQIAAHLIFDGRCEEAFNFYAQCLGGKIASMVPHRGSPAESHTPPEWLDKIMHARLVAGDQVLMGMDARPDHYKQPQGFMVTLQLKDAATSERIFNELSKDGKVQMPLQETFWAARFGMLVDRFGIPWMVNCEKASASASAA